MIPKFAQIQRNNLTKAFNDFFENEKSSGISLVVCAVLSLIIANTALSVDYLAFWKINLGGLSIAYWVNDGLMAVFFLLIGLELKREVFEGELSNLRSALLPVIAACGGVIFPALIHFSLNRGTPTQGGIGIPMATDIAFALSILALLGSRVPQSMKVFLAALAVIDDLIAIVVIAVFYTGDISIYYLLGSFGIFIGLMILNRLGFVHLAIYLLAGAVMWFFMLKSGVHATIAGVLLALTIPYTPDTDDDDALNILEHFLHRPVSFFVLPVFALANTGIVIGSHWAADFASDNSMGIVLGLVVGKTIGISLFTFLAVKSSLCTLPFNLRWLHIIGAGMLGGIGFTMSIFITNLAFENNHELVDSSKMAILLASLISGILGFIWLTVVGFVFPVDETSDAT